MGAQGSGVNTIWGIKFRGQQQIMGGNDSVVSTSLGRRVQGSTQNGSLRFKGQHSMGAEDATVNTWWCRVQGPAHHDPASSLLPDC